MYCANCDYDKKISGKKITKKFDESGLDNVILKGVIQYNCPSCGEDYYNYGNIEQLHDLIAQHLIRKQGLLISKEIRFLRKYMGYTSAMLAKLADQKPEHVSRIENGKVKVTALFDHFVRLMVIQKFPDRNYDLHDHILNQTGERFSKLVARYMGNRWNVSLIV